MSSNEITIFFLAFVVVACDEKRAPIPGPPPDLQPVAVRIDGPSQVTLPAEVLFTAVQIWSDGSMRDVTASAQWTSTNPLVLSVKAGVATALAGGEVALTVAVEQLTSQPKSVRVVPSKPEWDGTYTLTVGGGDCSPSLPLPTELRQRTYTAVIRQSSLVLSGSVANVGTFGGQILNPKVRFVFFGIGALGQRTSAMPTDGGIQRVSYRRVAYDGTEVAFMEVLPDSNRLLISGEASTTISSSGFVGTFNGSLALYEPSRRTLLGVCTSSSHGFSLVRK